MMSASKAKITPPAERFYNIQQGDDSSVQNISEDCNKTLRKLMFQVNSYKKSLIVHQATRHTLSILLIKGKYYGDYKLLFYDPARLFGRQPARRTHYTPYYFPVKLGMNTTQYLYIYHLSF